MSEESLSVPDANANAEDTPNALLRALYYARHFLLNADAKFIFAFDLSISALLTFIACAYCRFLYRGTWLFETFPLPQLLDLAVTGLVFWRMGVYKVMIRFTTMRDLLKLLAAIVLATIVLGGVYLVIWPDYYRVHIAGMVINFMMTSLALIGYRIASIGGRKWVANSRANVSVSSLKPSERKRVVLAGDLDACVQKHFLISELKSEEFEIVGFMTVEEAADNRRINNIPVRCVRREADIDDVMEFFQASMIVFVGVGNFLGDKKLADICLNKGIKLLISHDLLSSFHEYSGFSVDDVQIEDLMTRKEIAIDEALIDEGIRDMVVMVTGAAGSIGSELVRQICPFRPRRVILLDHAETPLWLIRQEIERSFPNIPLSTSITNVSHRRQLDICMRKYRPDLIFHAAAYKHVPLMEENPCVAVVNNVKGTMHLASMAVKYKTRRFVMVSTDKAVNPTSVMGATKRLAEIYVQSLGEAARKEDGEHATAFITTRFGNVLGSAGSVIPVFKEQIKRGGPVTVTHPDIIRYFMTIPEACRLILQANAMGTGGEVFVFDMGQQVKILDLAEKMIRLSGLAPMKDIPIEFTGLRPGEKLYEELLTDYEGTQETAHERIRIFQTKKYDLASLKILMESLVLHAEANNLEETVRTMKQLIPEYKSNNSPYQLYDKIETTNPLFE